MGTSMLLAKCRLLASVNLGTVESGRVDERQVEMDKEALNTAFEVNS